MKLLASAAAIIILGLAQVAYGHGVVMRIGSAQPNGGQLEIVAEFEFEHDVFVLPELVSIGGQTFYKDIFPSFTWIQAADASGVFPLRAGASVSLEVTNLSSPGVSMRLGGRLLDVPGATATIGTYSSDPEEHVHPEWQLLLPDGVTGQYSVSFRLRTAAAGYSQSPEYTLLISNVAVATPTASVTPTITETPMVTATEPASATPTPTPTEEEASATPTASETATPSPCAGDCDGDGVVTVDEVVRAVILALGAPTAEPCPAVDKNADGSVTVDEIVSSTLSALNGCV